MKKEYELLLSSINDAARLILVRDGFHNIAIYFPTFVEDEGERMLVETEVVLPTDSIGDALLEKIKMKVDSGYEAYAVVNEEKNGATMMLKVVLFTKDEGVVEIRNHFKRGKDGKVTLLSVQRAGDKDAIEVLETYMSVWEQFQIRIRGGEGDDD